MSESDKLIKEVYCHAKKCISNRGGRCINQELTIGDDGQCEEYCNPS